MSKGFPDFYNYEKRECLICNVLLQPDLKFVREHAKDVFHILKKMDKEAKMDTMDTNVFDKITKSPTTLIKETEIPVIDNEVLRHIENFANELKESIRKVMIDELTKGIGEAVIHLVDNKLKLYQEFFDVYALRMAKDFEKKGVDK